MGTGRLLTFSFRALVLLILVPVLWVGVAERYNQILVTLAGLLLSDDLSLSTLGSHIAIEHVRLAGPVSIDGLMLHYGLVLLTVLVLAAVGIGIVPRLGWLLGLGAGVFVLHVIGVALLAYGVGWATGEGSGDASGTFVFSLFAVFWGLLPAIIGGRGGAWSFLYWLPNVKGKT